MRLVLLAIMVATCGLASACGGGGGDGGGGGGGAPAPVHASLLFYNQAINLDTGTTSNSIMPGSGGPYPDAGWDFYFAVNGARPVHAVLFHHVTGGVAIAHLVGRTFDSVTAADVAGATFTTNLVDQPFDGNRVVLVRTGMNAVFKVGNASEDATTVSFDYALLVP